MKKLDVIAAVLLVIGGLNWGAVGVFNIDLVAAIFGGIPAVMTAVYVIVGLAAIYQGLGWKGIQTRWNRPEIATIKA